MDAAFLVGIINLFFAPVLSVYLYYKMTGQPVKLSLEILLQYSISVAVNVPITKIIIFVPKHFLHSSINIVSGYFTIAALIAACLQPILVVLLQNSSFKVEWKKNEKDTERENTKDEGTAE